MWRTHRWRLGEMGRPADYFRHPSAKRRGRKPDKAKAKIKKKLAAAGLPISWAEVLRRRKLKPRQVDSLLREVAGLRAELQRIRERIQNLLKGGDALAPVPPVPGRIPRPDCPDCRSHAVPGLPPGFLTWEPQEDFCDN